MKLNIIAAVFLILLGVSVYYRPQFTDHTSSQERSRYTPDNGKIIEAGPTTEDQVLIFNGSVNEWELTIDEDDIAEDTIIFRLEVTHD